MVSLQSALSSEVTKKRKRGDEDDEEGIELNLETPLPLEWQRCLDIKSGQIHYYNTRTHKRTSRDPRDSPEPASSPLPSIDLELNLTFEPRKAKAGPYQKPKPETDTTNSDNSKDNSMLPASASAITIAAADRQEMVAGVCIRCHMLVMMCRASPACPNCKFVHQLSRTGAPAAPKQGFKLLAS